MRNWPDYVLETVASVSAPTLGFRPSRGEAAAALEILRTHGEASTRKCAEITGYSVTALLVRLRKAGVSPVRKGGESGREGFYRIAEVLDALREREDGE